MASANKSTRSRFSSPLRSSSPAGHNRGLNNSDGQRVFMQRWLEPPLQNKPSFQEANLMRGGVVENMAPLGTLPKNHVKKSPVNGGVNGDRAMPPVKDRATRIVIKKPAQTPAQTPSQTLGKRESIAHTAEQALADQVESELDATPMSPLSQPLLPVPAMDDGEDDDYVPTKTKTRLSSHVQDNGNRDDLTPSANTRRHSTRRRSVRATPTPTVSSSSTHTSSPPPVFHAPPATVNRKPDQKLADKVIEFAVSQAINYSRYPTAFALRTLYDNHHQDPGFVSMIEDIYNQRADSDTIKEFTKLVSNIKKKGSKNDTAIYYFVPTTTAEKPTPKPAPYKNLVKMDLGAFRDEDDSDSHVAKKVKLEEQHPAANGNSPAKANGVGGHKGFTPRKSPRKSPYKSSRGKKTRSGSVSSSSSLSSVPDDVPDDYEEYMDQVDDDLGVARPMAAETNAQIPAGAVQPISGRDKKPAAKTKNASPKLPSSQNTPRHHPRSHDSSMAAAVVANGTTPKTSQQKTHNGSGLRFASRYAQYAQFDNDLNRRLVEAKHGNKIKITTATKGASQDSFIRSPLEADGLHDLSLELAVPQPPAAEQNRSSRTPALSSRAARAAKRHHHDGLDDSVSPTALSFRADLEPPSARNSRAATPSNLRSSKKTRGGLRVKTSPMKKKGTTAGIPRSSGDRPSPVGNGGVPSHQDENDDSCYTCGGNGQLVCCDGCNYSFHHLCIDPPMDEESRDMPEEWYCNECKHRYSPPFDEHRHKGVFRPMLTTLDPKNPRAFRLPDDVRDLFEGVRTGADGEYEEQVPPKPKPSKKGVEEAFDFFKVRNGDGSAVLCHQCQKGALDNRPIVPCSVCGLNWHLECLDPPLALPPVPRTFRCPLHMEDVLAELPQSLTPAHRHRKIKNAPVIEQGYTRGMANNGYIEVEHDDSEDEAAAIRRHKGFGQIQRLSAKGIKVDFIARVRKNRKASHGSTPAVTANRTLNIEEQQAASALMQLSQGSSDGLGQPHQAIMSQTGQAVVSTTSGDAQGIASESLESADTTSLEAMLARAEALTRDIRRVLAERTAPIPNEMTKAASSNLAEQQSTLPDTGIVDDTSSTTQDAVAKGDSAADSSAMQID